MKKKFILLCIICCISLLYVTGCESNEKDRDLIIKALIKQKIISDSMKQIDVQTKYKDEAAFGCQRHNYYIYQDDNKNLIAITFEKDNSSDTDYEHIINIYSNITKNEVTDILSEEDSNCTTDDRYVYENKEHTKEPRYEINSSEKYYAYKKVSIFGKKSYTIEKE